MSSGSRTTVAYFVIGLTMETMSTSCTPSWRTPTGAPLTESNTRSPPRRRDGRRACRPDRRRKAEARSRLDPGKVEGPVRGEDEHRRAEERGQIRDAVAGREEHRILVHLAPVDEDPDPADPVEENRHEEPEPRRARVEAPHGVALQVEREDDRGQVRARDAARLHDKVIPREVRTPVGLDRLGSLQPDELGGPFAERETQEREDREREKPRREEKTRGGASEQDAKGIEERQREDVEEHPSLQRQGVRGRRDEVNADELHGVDRKIQRDRETRRHQDQ